MNPRVSAHVRSPMVPGVVKVRAFERETHDVVTLSLEPPDSGFAFLPGQFNMLYVFGVGEAAISLSGDPATQAIVHTIRTVGSVTNALGRLQTGAAIGLRGPFGSAWPVEQTHGQDVVIVAGGIGLAPLRPALYQLMRNRKDYGQVVLLYGARTPTDVLFASELDAWQARGDLQVSITVDRGDTSWRGAIGLVTALFPLMKIDPDRTIGLICGPEIMMRFVQREFEKRGVADDRLYVSLERNMHCAVGFCGHCQFGPEFVCMDGPVFRYDRIKRFFNIREA